MKEVFCIKDVTGLILVDNEDREDVLLKDPHTPISFITYPEALNHISTLDKGYYQIEKIFIKD